MKPLALTWRLEVARVTHTHGHRMWVLWLRTEDGGHLLGRIKIAKNDGELRIFRYKRTARKAGRAFARAHGLVLEEKKP